MFSFIPLLIACALANANSITPLHGNFNRYYIYTRLNSRTPIELNTANVTESIDALSAERNTIVIVHGHGGSLTSSLNPTLKDAALTSEDVDVILVDWSVYATLNYNNAVNAVPGVGTSLASVIQELVTNEVVDLAKLHLIGFDLGGHVVGFTGRALGGKAARITGLNPSRGQWGSNSRRLNHNDAQYVEIIHTDGVGAFSHGVGDATGHVDFYPNGGTGQPGCLLNAACSHNRAWELMAASFTHDQLVGNRCDNWHQVSMNRCRGYHLRMGNNEFIKHGTGMFRVNTRRTYPYA